MRRSSRTVAMCGLAFAGALVLSTQAGCVKRKSGMTSAEREQVKAYILDELPSDVPNKVDVNFDNKVHLLGWKADPMKAAPGTTVHFTLWWKRTGDLDPGWMLFTHITTDNVKEAKGNLDCVGAIRIEKKEGCTAQLFPPSEWDKDKIIVDTFDYPVPAEVNWQTTRILVGIWKGDARLAILNADANDGDNRANVIALPTGVKPPEPPAEPKKTEVPKLNAPKFGKADTVKVDGKLDDAAWRKAADTGPFVQPGDGAAAAPDHPVSGSAKIAWDDANLYVGFTVADKNPTSPFKPTDVDPHIWEKSSGVELMIQPGNLGDNKDYYEVQVDSANAVWDTHFDDYNQPIDAPSGKFGHMEWKAGMKSAVSVQAGVGYTVEVAIPWSSFEKPRVAAPPKVGDVWRINLYSFRDGQGSSLAWSPIVGQGNFHKSARFAQVTFTGEMSAAPAASGSASAAPSGSAPPGPSATILVKPMPPPNVKMVPKTQ